MVLQYILIAILFVAAIAYVAHLFYKSFFSKKETCGGSCGCSAVDMKRIERQIEEKMEMNKERSKVS